MATRPFVLVGVSRLRAAQARLDAAIGEWRAAWGFAPEVVILTCASASPEGVHAAGWGASSTARAWIRFEDSFDERLRTALFAIEGDAWDRIARQSAPIAAEVARAARDDLVASLVAALTGRPAEPLGGLELEEPSAELAGRGSGAVAVRCDLAGAVLHVLMASEELAARDARSEPRAQRCALTGTHAAVERVPITVSVEVGSVEIDLGTLRHLVPGDVVRLGTPLEAALAVRGPDDTILCHGHLGAHHGIRAVDLVR